VLKHTTKARALPGKVIKGTKINEIVAIDHMTLTEATKNRRKYKYLLVYYDTFSKYMILSPTQTTGAEEAIKALESIFHTIPPPKIIVSDEGSGFTADIFQRMLARFNITGLHYLKGKPEGHSIERGNLIVSATVRMVRTAYKTRNWLDHLNLINDIVKAIPQTYRILSANGQVQKVKMSAFEFQFGSKPALSFEKHMETLDRIAHDAESLQRNRKRLHEAVKQHHFQSQEIQADRDEEHQRQHSKLKVGGYCVLQRIPRKKYLPVFYQKPFKLARLKGRKAILQEVGVQNPRSFRRHVALIKPLDMTSEGCDELPEALQLALGGNPFNDNTKEFAQRQIPQGNQADRPRTRAYARTLMTDGEDNSQPQGQRRMRHESAPSSSSNASPAPPIRSASPRTSIASLPPSIPTGSVNSPPGQPKVGGSLSPYVRIGSSDRARAEQALRSSNGHAEHEDAPSEADTVLEEFDPGNIPDYDLDTISDELAGGEAANTNRVPSGLTHANLSNIS